LSARSQQQELGALDLDGPFGYFGDLIGSRPPLAELVQQKACAP
jgi:hypothetical protein